MSEIEKKVQEEMNDDLIPGETAKRENKYKPYTGTYKSQPYSGGLYDDIYDIPYSPPPIRVITRFQTSMQANYDEVARVYNECPPFMVGDVAELDTVYVETVTLAITSAIAEILDAGHLLWKRETSLSLKTYIRDLVTTGCWVQTPDFKWHKNTKEME